MTVMTGVRLPGDSTVEHVEVDVPTPGHGQVLLAMKASSICGSDIRAIYREHLGTGAEAYRGVVAGHEPCGQVDVERPRGRDRDRHQPAGAGPVEQPGHLEAAEAVLLGDLDLRCVLDVVAARDRGGQHELGGSTG